VDDLGNGCTTHHEACACGEARHRAEFERLRAELNAERAVSASLREQLASLSGKVLGAAADRGAWREPVVLLREPFRPNVALMREIVQDLQDGGLLSAAPEEPRECSWCGGSGDDPGCTRSNCPRGCCVHCNGTGKEGE
jgi:hypothetical protein